MEASNARQTEPVITNAPDTNVAPVGVKIMDRLNLLITDRLPPDNLAIPSLKYLELDKVVEYHPFYEDFGPMNIGMVYRFCQLIKSQLECCSLTTVVLVCKHDPKSITNSVFLLGSYMIMCDARSPDEVAKVISPFITKIVSYRDVSPGPQNFHLDVQDCLQGLWRGKSLGWVDFSNEDGFDLDEYEELDNPANADLHEVVKGKFIAMRGPRALSGGDTGEDRWHDGPLGSRDFSPQHYAEILEQFDVRAVVRLNAHEYDAERLEASGIAVVDLPFEDCTTPPPDIVARFLMLAEGLPGVIAVHCKAGLGRTGTLIALYMMKHHGFSAREAIGWLRIVRPGSVIGPQQAYLCRMEAAARSAGAVFSRRGPAVTLGEPGVAGVYALAADVRAIVERRVRSVAPGADEAGAKAGGPAPGADEAREKADGPAPTTLATHVTEAAGRRAGERATAVRRFASWSAA